MFLFLFDIKAKNNQNSAELHKRWLNSFEVTVGTHCYLQVT